MKFFQRNFLIKHMKIIQICSNLYKVNFKKFIIEYLMFDVSERIEFIRLINESVAKAKKHEFFKQSWKIIKHKKNEN